MFRLVIFLTSIMLASSAMAADVSDPDKGKDPFFGEALYYAYQGEWFEAIAKLDTELKQFRRLDQPELDSFYRHADLAEFDVGDFELAYRMHQRAGRAIKAVIEADIADAVRNKAIFRLARIYFQKDQPENALRALERIQGEVPEEIREDLAFLRAQILMHLGRFAEAGDILKGLLEVKGFEGFASYDLGIALLRSNRVEEGRKLLDDTGQILSDNPVTLAIKDKSNLVLGDKLLNEKKFEGAKEMFDRVRLNGPFSNRALLGSGWADASREQYDRALVPWSILVQREITDKAVQEALLAVPYAYGKLEVFSQAAVLYGRALAAYGQEIEKLSASIGSIRAGDFLRALVRNELKQDRNWVVNLRELPEAPETYYLLDLMAANDFQESLKNYLDLEELRRKLETWSGDLDAYEELVGMRRDYYQPLLNMIDGKFKKLDSQMRLQLEQRDRIAQRLQTMLVTPRPDYLATAEERGYLGRIARLEQDLVAGRGGKVEVAALRLSRLRGVLGWKIQIEYDQRLTAAYQDLHELNQEIAQMRKQYVAFARSSQAATHSYQGFDDLIRAERNRVEAAQEKVAELMSRQGEILEAMAVNELSARLERLKELQVKARFAMADSYDRATRAKSQEEQ